MIDMLRVHNTESRLLCIIQMLKETICSWPVPVKSLQRLISAVSAFYCWPRPFGPLAQRLLALAEREISSPGAAFREVFLRDHKDLELELDYRPRAVTIPLLIDGAFPNSHYVQSAVVKSNSSAEPVGGQLKAAQVLHHILQHAGHHVVELPSESFAILQELAVSAPQDIIAA